jgi:hypothetical protein
MYFRNMTTKSNITTILLLIGISYSIYSLFQNPEAVAWAASALAHLVVLISIKTENIPSFDSEFLGIINVSLGVVATVVSAGQWFILDQNGPLAILFSASALAIWAFRPRKEA